MTLIAAAIEPETRRVHMIADTYGYSETRCYANVRKIQPRRLYTPNGLTAGRVLIGHAGEHSVSYVARNAPMPTVTRGADPWVVADGIAKALQEYGAELPGGINYHGGTDQIWLVGWNGHLWEFVHYDIIECSPFGAVGAGDAVALGALEALGLGEVIDYKDGLIAAGHIAAKHCHIVKPPFLHEIAEPL